MEVEEIRKQLTDMPQLPERASIDAAITDFANAEARMRRVPVTLKARLDDLETFHEKNITILGDKWATLQRKSGRIEMALAEEMHFWRFEKPENERTRLSQNISDLKAWLQIRNTNRAELQEKLRVRREEFMSKAKVINSMNNDAREKMRQSFENSSALRKYVEDLKHEEKRLDARLEYLDYTQRPLTTSVQHT
eukprot:GEMP01081987.1.p1 GENE.GEMP01081987.1~~GEMP01081987.1.p1  ORF type:complete len:194 (+),score=50.35 GEMP01081987.1:222-803(+)